MKLPSNFDPIPLYNSVQNARVKTELYRIPLKSNPYSETKNLDIIYRSGCEKDFLPFFACKTPNRPEWLFIDKNVSLQNPVSCDFRELCNDDVSDY